MLLEAIILNTNSSNTQNNLYLQRNYNFFHRWHYLGIWLLQLVINSNIGFHLTHSRRQCNAGSSHFRSAWFFLQTNAMMWFICTTYCAIWRDIRFLACLVFTLSNSQKKRDEKARWNRWAVICCWFCSVLPFHLISFKQR